MKHQGKLIHRSVQKVDTEVSQPTETEVLSKAVINVAKKLDLSQKLLSEILGMSTSEMSRLFAHQSFISLKSKEGECAILLIRVYRSLDSLLGGTDNQSRDWLLAYNHHLGGKPVELAKTITGLVSIVKYLDAMRGLA